jgi:hypothetical protein
MLLRRYLLILSLAASGCGAPAGVGGLSTTLTVDNEAQTPLQELRVHAGDLYAEAPNLLTGYLAPQDRIDVDFKRGQRVTVFRQRVQDGPIVAYTTEVGLDVNGPGYMLIVFDRSFRLMQPGY